MTDPQTPEAPAQVDWEAKYNELKAESRKWEERSKANYDELQKAQSDLGSFQSRVTELETSNTDLAGKVKEVEDQKTRAALVAEVAKTAGVDPAVLRGSTKEELEEHAETLKTVFAPSAPVIEGQANTPGNPPVDELREFTRNLFKKDD